MSGLWKEITFVNVFHILYEIPLNFIYISQLFLCPEENSENCGSPKATTDTFSVFKNIYVLSAMVPWSAFCLSRVQFLDIFSLM